MRRLFPVFITLLIISCQKDSNSFSVTGVAEGFADGTPIYVYEVTDSQPQVIDTLTITEEKFEAMYPKSEVLSINYLRIGENNSSIVYFPENEDLKVTLYKDSLASSYVSGSKQNDAYTAFSKKIRYFNAVKQTNMERFNAARNEQDNMLVTQIQKENMAIVQEETNYKKQFALDNNNSLFSVMLMSEMLGRKEISFDDADVFVKSLSPKVAALAVSSNLQAMITNAKKAEVGSVAPDFSAPTPTGEILALTDVLGKYTIIDFWASWCKPCRMENPNVVNVYNQYHDKGLNIISVSLDKDDQKDRWIKAIKDDKMDWYHVSNLKFWNDPIARMYNIRAIPATFLLDENGTIIAKDLRGPALGAKIASLLGQ
ncbi:peroxiredoxin [Ulvibacter sp. MAR_2010_11]|uniref:TlpA disulfide reductase family protein n=1 Tax=Ulvibacter sp. MAR_2010_11 TaxID=1250229 RepID=UPI000C2C172C|nr:TlpA disulfide reductase family protein [Ulvibacter sp. MAR_2010_11]PKA84375.1 peroxiredoxin [Ulvibacter sp. MAR_2010_11]